MTEPTVLDTTDTSTAIIKVTTAKSTDPKHSINANACTHYECVEDSITELNEMW